MKHVIRTRLAVLATVAFAAFGGAASGAAQQYVPFVSDFPQRPAAAEPYRPFATDFGIAPRPAGGGFTLPAKRQGTELAAGRAWGDVALGAGAGLAFAALVGAAGLAVVANRRQVA